MSKSIKSLILGDVVGKAGCRALYLHLNKLIKKTQADITIANGENATEGRGISVQDLEGLFSSGVNVVTSGNHIWQKREILPLLDSDDRLLRPENYPSGVPGKGHYIGSFKGITVGVCNLMGRAHMADVRCPFRVGKEIVSRLRRETEIILVDFHAELSDEKEALGLYLDGTITALVGTHTHVQTADERILSGGTGYITDIGMTGPLESVIGMSIETAVRRSLTQMPLKLEVEESPAQIDGVLLDINAESGKTRAITRIHEVSTF